MTSNKRSPESVRVVTKYALVAYAVWLLACSHDPSSFTSPQIRVPLAAQLTSNVVVSAAAPDSATQDTTLDVTISGSGFVAGSTATWQLSGVADPTQVKTNRTTYVSSRKIIANITISATATATKWDVAVYAGTKGGVGTEMFAIKVHGNTAIPTVSLNVAVSDTDASGNPYNIHSDGQGIYADGLQGVQAILDQNGVFVFNMINKRTAIRGVNYNFNNPVDPSNTYRPTLPGYHFVTRASAYSPSIPIQYLGVGGNPVTECVSMGNGLTTDITQPLNSSTSWNVSFHYGREDLATSPTSYAVVTRTSVSPAIWTIAPSGACSPASNIASLRSSDGSVLFGYYHLPFHFTLTAK